MVVGDDPILFAGFKRLICVSTSSVRGMKSVDEGFGVINESKSKFHVGVGAGPDLSI